MILICPDCGKEQDISDYRWGEWCWGGKKVHPFTCTCGAEMHVDASRLSNALFHADRFEKDLYRYLRHVLPQLARPRAWMHHRWKGGFYTNWNYKNNRNWRRLPHVT